MVPAKDYMYDQIFKMLGTLHVLGMPSPYDKQRPDWHFQFLARNLKSGKVLCDILSKLNPGCFERRRISFHEQSPEMFFQESVCLRNATKFFCILIEEYPRIKPQIDASDIFPLQSLGQDDPKRDYLLKLLCDISHTDAIARFGVHSIQHVRLYSAAPRSSFVMPPYDEPPEAPLPRGSSLTPTAYSQYIDSSAPAYGQYTDSGSTGSLMDTEVPIIEDKPIPQYGNNPSDLYQTLMPCDEPVWSSDDANNSVQDGQIYGLPTMTKGMRTMIIDELVSSEKTYITLLQDIWNLWVEPLSKILHPKEIEIIFMNLGKIKRIHEKFYEDILKEKNEVFNRRIVSACFFRMIGNLLEYKDYLTKIDKSQEEMTRIMNTQGNETYKKAIQLIDDNGKKSSTIFRRGVNEALVIPMERLCRYPIFMERLIKESGPDHPDTEKLQEVYALLKQINNYINTCSGDNTGIAARDKIERRTGVSETVKYGFPLRAPDTKFAEGLMADKVTVEGGAKMHREKVEVFIYHQALVVIFFEGKYEIETYPFEDICQTPENMPDMLPPEKLSRSLFASNNNKWKVRLRLRSPVQWMELKFSNETFAKTFYARLRLHFEKFKRNFIKEWTIKTVPPNHKCQEHFPLSCCDICLKLFNGLEVQGYSTLHRPNYYVHEDCIVNVPVIINRVYTADPLEIDELRNQVLDELKNERYFAGDLPRNRAIQAIRKSERGQFLVRTRSDPNDGDVRAPYAVTMKTHEGRDRHMKIFEYVNSDGQAYLRPKFYFAEAIQFQTVVQLIYAYTHERDLHTAFPDLSGNFTGSAAFR